MARKSKAADMNAGDSIIIKKYANRRLYNTSSSSYITLDDLAKMVRENVDFQVLDAKSGDDITHSILTQIIMDEESNGGKMLPVSFLRQLIGMYGNSMQNLMPSYLEASMTNFRENQSKIRDAFEKGMSANPLAAIHETNMALMRAAAETLIPGAKKDAPARRSPPETPDNSDTEIAALREQMAAMQKKLDELG
ncbi:polyhydroxyalkanoate synthesis repressor PhaR [Erythrobacter crassostreae]|uniref:Polyhydroxyalkanoate synthesis repressor PhaR n=1 Tax=Erythrobacter crassostreae TaxID=2828328 RepID=A0A9X1F4B9_9SPHN|nr:polyhydroxyalkanoate synthesis repressor PhaR [Erythrobacter crassostrea]MBV7260007.1 polyhydroxyalkanoate synthesis repressor PhaR [Erythrobacter crassostrea]